MTNDPTTDRYRKRPVEIEARQLLGSDDGEPARELAAWCGGSIGGSFDEPRIVIPTLEGEMRATPGDWIIRGVQGEFYPCKPDIFEQTYEPASVPSAPTTQTADAETLRWDLYDDLDAFARDAGIPGLQYAQIRDRLAVFLTERLLRRLAAVPAAVEEQPGTHVYLSTGCLHGEHNYCSNVDGIVGLKKPAQCKFCAAPCTCACHRAAVAQPGKEN